MKIDGDRLFRRFSDLGALTDPDHPWTRRAFTPLFDEGRTFLRAEMEKVGLDVRVDPAGNLIGRLEGSDPALPPIMTGSHSDTVPDGGRFDGIAGVLCGIEAAQALADAGMRLRHPVEVVDFLAEEPTDFGVSCIGSRGLSGALADDMLARRHPETGEALADAIRRIGGDPDRRQAVHPKAFVELHIEQGPVLERTGTAIGVVSSIVGILRAEVTVTGRPDHAGTTPMNLRHDALAGAARLIAWISETAGARAAALPEAYLVATVGRLSVSPNAANIVPARVSFILDVRSSDVAERDRLVNDLQAVAPDLLRPLRLDSALTVQSTSQPAQMDARVQQCIAEACVTTGHTHRVMPSGAGHDAGFLSRQCPTGMLFVPCRDGRSHCPEEWASQGDLEAGTEVLMRTLMLLDDT